MICRMEFGMGRRRVRRENLKEGMILADDVYNTSDQMIFPKKTILTDKHIEKLSLYHILAVNVEKEEEAEEKKADSESELVKPALEDKQTEEKKQMEQLLNQTTIEVQRALDSLLADLKNQDALETMVQSVKGLLKQMQSAGDLFDLLVQVQ